MLRLGIIKICLTELIRIRVSFLSFLFFYYVFCLDKCIYYYSKLNSNLRPHPNECSGSDLDGDIYFVCWDHELVPPMQKEPMDYTPAPSLRLDHDVTVEVLISFIYCMNRPYPFFFVDFPYLVITIHLLDVNSCSILEMFFVSCQCILNKSIQMNLSPSHFH